MRSWRVIRWDEQPEKTAVLAMSCEHCGTEALLPVGQTPKPIAGMGMGFVFEPADFPPPKSWRPDEIECRVCHHVYGGD